jgi:hypothetical protein
MAMTADDTAHASVRVAESVVALARAEIHLAFSSARAAGERLVLTLALSAVAVLLVQAAFVVLVLTPFLWTFRPGPTLVALALALGTATLTSFLALRRWRSLGRSRIAQASHPAAVSHLEGTRA